MRKIKFFLALKLPPPLLPLIHSLQDSVVRSSLHFVSWLWFFSCTPLHMSAGHRGKLEVSFLLVEHGARIFENNIHGVRPVDLEPVWFFSNLIDYSLWMWNARVRYESEMVRDSVYSFLGLCSEVSTNAITYFSLCETCINLPLEMLVRTWQAIFLRQELSGTQWLVQEHSFVLPWNCGSWIR